MSKRENTIGILHRIPIELQKSLATSPLAEAAWKDITPLARNEWICWVISTKKPETRARRIDRTRSELIEGKRRPCCFAGCTHRFI